MPYQFHETGVVDFWTALLNPSLSTAYWGKLLVGSAYLLWVLLFVIMIWRGFKDKSYGMPLLAMVTHLAVITLCAFVGPWSEEVGHLFCVVRADGSTDGLCPEAPGGMTLIWLWRLAFVLQGTVFVQYLIWGYKHPHVSKLFKKYFYFIAFGSLVSMYVTIYLFIIFYRDFYINEASPLAVLMMAFGYLASLLLRPKLKGLSLSVAWLLAISTALLSIGTLVGDLANPFPNHEDTGYGLVYWIYGLTVALFVFYAVLLTKRRDELHEDHDSKQTFRELFSYTES